MFIVDICKKKKRKDKHVYLYYKCVYREVSSRYPVHVQCKREFLFLLQMRLSDLISVLLGVITFKHCMGFKCKYKCYFSKVVCNLINQFSKTTVILLLRFDKGDGTFIVLSIIIISM